MLTKIVKIDIIPCEFTTIGYKMSLGSVGQALPTSPSSNHVTMERLFHQIPSPSQALLKRVVIVVLGFLALMKILFTALEFPKFLG